MTTFTGTSGDDVLTGTSGGDDFHIEQGGEDKAVGGAGIDVFYLGAAFDAGDRINGGHDRDFIVLDGDYSAGLVFQATTMASIEEIDLTTGFSYAFSGLTDVNLTQGLVVDGSALGAGEHLDFDASGLDHQSVTLLGGAGDDSLIGGAGADSIVGGDGEATLQGGLGNDRISFGAGAASVSGGDGNDILTATGAFTSDDMLNGGKGNDSLTLLGGDVVLSDANIVSVEKIGFHDAANVVALDNLVSAGHIQWIFGGGQGDLSFNGKKETDGRFHLIGRDELDTLIGGANSDTMKGGNGADRLVGNDGDDHLWGNNGHDTLFGGAGDDTLVGGYGKSDLITGGDGNDWIAADSASSTLDGGAGDDEIVWSHGQFGALSVTGGEGADSLDGSTAATLIYLGVGDSTAEAPDLISYIYGPLTLDLSAIDADTTTDGDQAFHLAGSFSGSAGELVLSYDSFRDLTSISGDVDGDGVADLLITAKGEHTDFTGFVF